MDAADDGISALEQHPEGLGLNEKAGLASSGGPEADSGVSMTEDHPDSQERDMDSPTQKADLEDRPLKNGDSENVNTDTAGTELNTESCAGAKNLSSNHEVPKQLVEEAMSPEPKAEAKVHMENCNEEMDTSCGPEVSPEQSPDISPDQVPEAVSLQSADHEGTEGESAEPVPDPTAPKTEEEERAGSPDGCAIQQPKDEQGSVDIPVKKGRDYCDEAMEELKEPVPNTSSTKTPTTSAISSFPKVVITDCSKNCDLFPSLSSPNESLPSDSIDHESQKVDKLNNNIQKCSSFCQEPSELVAASCESLPASSKVQEVCEKESESPEQASISLKKAVKDLGGNQDRSMLMKYLGLQPVLENGQSQTSQLRDKDASIKPKHGFPFFESFGLMPGLEPFHSYEKVDISKNTSPFDVCSDGSHSPEPPILAETPVVGSSPPRHDYDAMEARMADMTPRSNSMMGRSPLLSSFPSSDQMGQDIKSILSKQHLPISGSLPSSGLYPKLQGEHAGSPFNEETMSTPTFPTYSASSPKVSLSESKKPAAAGDIVPCPRCHRTFKNRNQLRGHLRWHINDPINLLSRRWSEKTQPKVPFSGAAKKPSNQSGKGKELPLSKVRVKLVQRNNIQGSGTKQDTFPCTLCPKVFRTSLKLRGHMMVHKRKQPKRKGPFWKNKPSKHSRSHGRTTKHQCEICSEGFDSQFKLSNHMASHANEVHPRSKGVKRSGSDMSHDDMNSSEGSTQGTHTGVRHKVSHNKQKSSFKCDVCFKTFPSLRARNGHLGIHSAKWKMSGSAEETSSPTQNEEMTHTDSQGVSQEESGSKLGNAKTLNYRMPFTFFQCDRCRLVFASKHRVRKHLTKVHSVLSPGNDFFSEEKVEGCKFCEVFKKRKRGRPKQGENKLVKCPHGKIVVGYNLPLNSMRNNRKSRLLAHKQKHSIAPQTAKIPSSDGLSDIGNEKSAEGIPEDNSSGDVEGMDDDVAASLLKRQGRASKGCVKPLLSVKSGKSALYRVAAARSHLTSLRRQKMGKGMTLLGKQLKSGWDPKRQRFIGRPYKCHLCTMAYRSERQLCSHMRSHGIHIFDLSQLPADQRANHLASNGEMGSGMSGEEDGLQGFIGTMNPNASLGNPNMEDQETYAGRKPSESSGVGGVCSVCSKEFDSDNMFHQHLLGRFNKKCRQEWMKQTFGFGTRVQSLFRGQEADDTKVKSETESQSNGDMYVIDKISLESFQGSSAFSSLQQKVSDKIETAVRGETSIMAYSADIALEERQDIKPLTHGNSSNGDSELVSSPLPKKGAVLDAVISRLTQSSKTTCSSAVEETTGSSRSVFSVPGSAKRKKQKSDKRLFKCNLCGKAFDKKQKLSVHSIIHKPKVATVMDHVESASQGSVLPRNTLSNGSDQDRTNGSQMPSNTNGVTPPPLPVSVSVPPLQLLYSCTECPKQFTSNLKLASHIKMHMKSIKRRSHSPERVPSENLNIAKQPSVSAVPEVSNHTTKLNEVNATPTIVSQEDVPREEKSENTSSSPPQVLDNPTSETNCIANSSDVTESIKRSTDPTESVISSEKEVNKKAVNQANGVEKDGKQSVPSRPRLLLKINPATLLRLHECQECHKTFKSRRQLANHQKEHTAERLADENPNTEALAEHSNTHLNQPMVVSETSSSDMFQIDHSISRSFHSSDDVSEVSLQANKTLLPELTIPCKICDEVMKKSELDSHMKSHTKDLLSRTFNKENSCDKLNHGVEDYSINSMSAGATGFSTANDSYMSSHLNNTDLDINHASEDQCQNFSPGEDLTQREISDAYTIVTPSAAFEDSPGGDEQFDGPEKEQYTCHICSESFNYYRLFTEHLKVHVVKDPSAPLNATDCSAASKDTSVNPSPFEESFPQNFVQPKVYPCELCGFSFSSFRQFRVHISQTHGGKYQYRLMIQQKEAAKAGAFLKEPETINKTHPHKCDVCGRRFKRLALLIFHLNKLHKGWKQRLCMMNVRSRPRPAPVGLQTVAQGKGSSAPGVPGIDPADLPFTCELCGKSFRMKVQLCGHMKTHGRVGHSPIKITPLALKGKYTLRKRGKPDFRLSNDWILDMADEQIAMDKSLAMQQQPMRPVESSDAVKGASEMGYYPAMYAAKPMSRGMPGDKEMAQGYGRPGEQFRMPASSPTLPSSPPATNLKIPVAPPPPDPSKFITIQLEPVLQQMLHRCLLCHSYFSSQESAILHCREVHFKKRPKFPPSSAMPQGNSHPLGHFSYSEMPSQVKPSNCKVSPGGIPRQQYPPTMFPSRAQMSPGMRPVGPQLPRSNRAPVSQVRPGVRSPASQLGPGRGSPAFEREAALPSRFRQGQPTSLPYSGPIPTSKSPTSTPSAKTISQTPFNEMLYRVEMSEGQTRYVCNTCKSTFLHHNYLMSHLADHNHLAYTCLQCGYSTYSEKDYQLHCQLHDGQISKKVRKVRPKPPSFTAPTEEKQGAPRAVATCHICQRSFVNMKGLKAHMVLHSANFSSISERRNESKRVNRKHPVKFVPASFADMPEPLSLVKPSEEQTEALDLTVKPVVESPMDEVLDLSIGSKTSSFREEIPEEDVPQDLTKPIPEEAIIPALPDVCQVLEKVDFPEEPPRLPSPVEKPPTRKPKNSIRLVGAIDVDVASLENKYSIVTDLLDTDSDISPDVGPSGQEPTSGSGEGDAEHDGKSPKKFRNYKCGMCQYATDFKDSMDRHEQKHRKFRTLACHQCSYRTPEKRLMLRHVLTIHEKQKPYQCQLCSYSSAYKHHLKRHHTKRHQRVLLTCSQCEFTTEDVAKLESHSLSHPEPKTYGCKLCPMVFNTSKLLKAHKHIVHKKKKSKKSSRDKTVSSSGVSDSSASLLDKDKESLANTEPAEPVNLKYHCKLCKYQTDDQNELTKHLMKKHFANQSKDGVADVCTTVQCPQCGYLTGKDQLKAHMQIHDSGEFFNCDQCLFKACDQEELDAHIQQKHKVKATAKLTCKMCGMHFWDAEDIKQHTEIHLRDSSISIKNPFLCNMCPLKLMNRRDALRHLQLHTDRYPFKCRHCVFSCFTKASIQRHLSIHRHASKPKSLGAIRKNSRKSVAMAANPAEGSLPGNWKKSASSKSSQFGPVANRLPVYQCEFCCHKFRVAEDWQRHVKRHHMTWSE